MESRNCHVSDSLHDELTNFNMDYQFVCLCYFESYEISTSQLKYYVIFQYLK